ncbi:unnamed protein product [Caenorhabditis angaria]|uniref:non-specific serine/threonine protein kinase n=1 Tax=Caenorhabditis angaria TaxID=860376 RepID=A0A9P1IHV7_9PELO|nr:unnamed protein product [Caenorhabditis angaria]
MEVPLSLSQPATSAPSNSGLKSMADYKVLKEIGEGSFSIVYHAVEKEGAQRDVAIKMCLKKQIIRDKRVKYVHREKSALALLSTGDNWHPSIVTLYATFQDAENLFFVLSYAKYHDLLHIILQQPDKHLNFNDSVYYSAMLLDALNHCHKLGVVHRDVKPENLLVKNDGRIMLTDFGSSMFIEEHEKEYTQNGRRASFVGTAQFVCPEMLTGGKLGTASDIWSFAVVIFQFLTGDHAFHDESEYLIFRRVQDILFKYPEGFNDLAKDLIDKILFIDPEKRLKYSEIIVHPFFENIDFSSLQSIEPPKIYL